ELRRVPARERRIGTERGCDLEDAPEPGRLRHLLEELGALGEVRGRLEVLELEQLRTRLARARHELRGVNLDVVALHPVAAPRVLEGRLDAEHQLVLRHPQVEEAPVLALVGARVVSDRGFRYRL